MKENYAVGIESPEEQTNWENIQFTKSYGVSIDTHRDFIQVCVLVKHDDEIRKIEQKFYTSWWELGEAREWIVKTIETNIHPVPNDILPLRYSIESTGTYHIPVIKALGGKPSVVNPLLASPSRRKTDVLDAKMLAQQNMTGLWPESYIVTDEVQELRLLIAQRNYHKQQQTKISNQINNYILRFGHTLGRLGSVTKSKVVRPMVEDLIDNIADMKNLCQTGIPEDVRPMFKEMYRNFDFHADEEKRYMSLAISKAKKMLWETEEGIFVRGDELIKNLCTVPGVGETTAVLWLSIIITPSRFPTSKAISAYCGLDPSLKISAGKVTSTVKRGGNKDLHYSLNMSAGTLLRSRTENFGVWGYNLYKSSGKWKKASNAVGRKICVAMYHVNKLNVPFSYDQYRCYEKRSVMNISLDELFKMFPDMKRFKKALINAGFTNTKQIVDEYYEGRLKEYRGLGKTFYTLLKDFIFNQKKYIEISEKNNQENEGEE